MFYCPEIIGVKVILTDNQLFGKTHIDFFSIYLENNIETLRVCNFFPLIARITWMLMPEA